MYTLSQPLNCIKGIGPILQKKLAAKKIYTILDFLLFLPIRYEDRSKFLTIDQIKLNLPNDFITLKAKVLAKNNFYRHGKSIQTALVADQTGQLKLMWFNNKFILTKLKEKDWFWFSGKVSPKRIMIQATVEKIQTNTIHTGRLVPIYSQLKNIKQGQFRRLQQEILNNLIMPEDQLKTLDTQNSWLDLANTFKSLHFPQTPELVIQARERLALEELLMLIQKSYSLKKIWQKRQHAIKILPQSSLIPKSLPFKLTKDQTLAVNDIMKDLAKNQTMNRLLVGDVRSGKTIVAILAARQVLQNHQTTAIIAPTQILAKQHLTTINHLFPQIKTKLIIANSKIPKSTTQTNNFTPKFYIGTHALINKLSSIKPALIIYDEQHRFGVNQRQPLLTAPHQLKSDNDWQPHILTMSATPIPRSLMLTIFSHLNLSYISQLPPGRIKPKTWLIPPAKKLSAYDWFIQQLIDHPKKLGIIIAPFIKPSEIPGFEHIANVTAINQQVRNLMNQKKLKLNTAILHSQLTQKQKDKIIHQLFDQKIQLLITTAVIEVGLDVPNADLMIIEDASRFGLASLHQLRGRVGRANQLAYCLVMTDSNQNDRLKQFQQETNGFKLAELDLKRRGAGDLFGLAQTGFETLKFASWTNLALIAQAKRINHLIEQNQIKYQSILKFDQIDSLPAAN